MGVEVRAETAALLGCLTLSLTACLPGPQACTLIGALQGLTVTVDGTQASTVESLTLTICVGADCMDTEVHLSEPEVVSTEVRGFAMIELPEEEVQVQAKLIARDGSTSTHTTAVVPEMVYPNGEQCGGGATQASLILDDDGLRQD